MNGTIHDLQVGDTATLVFPMTIKPFGLPRKPFTPPDGSVFFIHIEHETAGEKVAAGIVAVSGTNLLYVTQPNDFNLDGLYTVQIFGRIAASETTAARDNYESPVFTHRRLPNVGVLTIPA